MYFERRTTVDFYQITSEITKNGIKIYPDFKACRSKDLMIRGRSFYAIWDDDKQMWSTDEYDVQRLVDQELDEHKREAQIKFPDRTVEVKRMLSFSSNMWKNYRAFVKEMADNAHQLDTKVTFANTEVKKKDYISRRLNYPLEGGKYDAFDEIIGTLYEPDERAKLEWSIGAIISGDAKDIQKFIVLYGEGGTGKSTILNIIQKIFEGYYTMFEAKALTSTSSSFATEVFRSNPLVAIQHDGDLSKIEDNTRLNSIVSHEEMTMNEKYKSPYDFKPSCFLFMGTNKPVKITDAKSGIIRRLIDVRPTGNKIPNRRYHTLMGQIDFELGAIAWRCLNVYKEMGKNYYASYRPLEMMFQTDVFFNFVEAQYHIFKEQDGVTLSQAYEIYKTYCDDALVEFKLPRHKFREELKSYFDKYLDMTRIDGKQIRSYYSGFLSEKFSGIQSEKQEAPYSLVLDNTVSIVDGMLSDCPAQYATEQEIPQKKWEKIITKLSDINTKKLHYVRPPLNHIVIDFDLKDESGKKSMDLNLSEASKWPTTYAEFSKSEAGIHLHYIYDGDVEKLSRVYSEGIEVKVFTGNAPLRRKLSKCNNSPVATINSGLPLKGEKMINFKSVQSEKGLRALIARNLNKEIHPGTKSSIDFIHDILEKVFNSGMKYDVTDLRPKILAFANNSSNQADYCIKLVNKMKFTSEEASVSMTIHQFATHSDIDANLIFYDVEVFPNLFVVCWKIRGKDRTVVKMINPKASDLESLLKSMLVGFNCRRYDNHIMYAAYIGYTNLQLYELSQRIINGSANAMFGEAYNISYTDIYDFASARNKMSLKKWEIKLGIHHQELGLPWDQPVPEEKWNEVADYCCNDVVAEEVVFDHLAGDWAARQILAELSGLSVNDTTNQHTTKIVFGNEKKPQSQFMYPDLSEMFPGYKFENGVSTYRDIVVGEGGRVYAEPGIYINPAVLDVVSQHPTSIEQENLFGPYTKNYSDLKKGRVAIKHKDFDTLKILLGGRLMPFIEDAIGENPRFTLKDVSNGLKTALVSAYGLTFASFENPFRDPRNKDNVVCKRGALFMIDLQYAVQEKGFQVAHIKTDSIKIPNANKEIIDFVMDFGKKYGYEFEHESTYEKMCLVNDAVYIAKYASAEACEDMYGYVPEECKKHPSEWTATGTQFAQPYVFKTLFSHEPIVFEDMCETKTVTVGALYLDMNEDLPEDKHNYHFIGKAGSFCPVIPGSGGGTLLRVNNDKYYAATGSKGYKWLEAEMVKNLEKEEDIDRSYYDTLVDDAVEDISKYGDFEWFISEQEDKISDDEPIGFNDVPPWCMPCGKDNCVTCNNWVCDAETGYKCKLGYAADSLPF
jgi:phage/plasmid-associated DNA primase